MLNLLGCHAEMYGTVIQIWVMHLYIFTVYSHQKSGKGEFDGGYKFYWVNMLYPPSHHICPPYHSLEAHPPLSGTVSTPSHTPPTNLHTVYLSFTVY